MEEVHIQIIPRGVYIVEEPKKYDMPVFGKVDIPSRWYQMTPSVKILEGILWHLRNSDPYKLPTAPWSLSSSSNPESTLSKHVIVSRAVSEHIRSSPLLDSVLEEEHPQTQELVDLESLQSIISWKQGS